MTVKRNTTSLEAVSVRTRTASQATTAETMAFTMIAGVALVSLAIGSWSILAFAAALAGQGPLALAGGFVGAVAGI